MALSQKEKDELNGFVHAHGIIEVVKAHAEDWSPEGRGYKRALRVCLFLLDEKNHHKKVSISEEM